MLNISAGFTKSASKALLQAQLCAAAMGAQRMGSAHLLLGLARAANFAMLLHAARQTRKLSRNSEREAISHAD